MSSSKKVIPTLEKSPEPSKSENPPPSQNEMAENDKIDLGFEDEEKGESMCSRAQSNS